MTDARRRAEATATFKLGLEASQAVAENIPAYVQAAEMGLARLDASGS